MPTDDERREVAARLRDMAGGYANIPAWRVIACGELPAPIDDVMYAAGLGRTVHASEICSRLADLIEPEERTCIDDGVGVFRCTSCGAFALPGAVTDLCGPIPIRYCPNCGARVVEE